MKVKVTKVNGNNNNFVLLFNDDVQKKIILNKINIKKLCQIDNNKVDGLLVLNYINQKKVYLDYYNNDGTWETLCANGTRCASLFLYKKYNKKIFYITCGDGIHKTKIMNNNIAISMPRPKYIKDKILVENLIGYYIDSGAKHFIIKIDSNWPTKNQLISIAKKIRYNKELFPDGININFYKIIDDSTLQVITYEKGIENIVESCASGSYACAYHVSKQTLNRSFLVINNGGNLSIQFSYKYLKNYITAKAVIENEYFISI